jgi:hypothetical protein
MRDTVTEGQHPVARAWSENGTEHRLGSVSTTGLKLPHAVSVTCVRNQK